MVRMKGAGGSDWLSIECLATELNELDPPEHLFRIRLVCTLLDTCGQYFDRGTSKKRLDCFLQYFQVNNLFCLIYYDMDLSLNRDIIISKEINLFGMRLLIHFHWRLNIYSMNVWWIYDRNLIKWILMRKRVNK